MKNFLLLVLLSFFTVSISIAQVQRKAKTQAGTMQHKKHGKKGGLKNIQLTKIQKGQLKEIKADFKNRKSLVKNNTALSETERKSQMKALAAERRTAVMKILTEQQRQQLISADPKYSPTPKRGATNMLNERTAK